MFLKKRGNKKAQITIFVIIAVIILIIGGIIFFSMNKGESFSDIKREFKEESIPEEFKPVRDYVKNCIHTVGIEAIKKMGAHGGYIYPLDNFFTPNTLVFSPAYPEYSTLVSLSGDAEAIVPYYLYVPGKASYSNYDINSVAPTVENMEYQLSTYMFINVPLCTAGFEAFKEAGFVVTENSIDAYTIINNETINFYVDYDLNITKEGVSTKMSKFQDELKFPFMKYYSLALSLTDVELTTQFLESFSLSLVNYYSGLDFSKLPPIVEYSDDPYIITWSNSKVNLDINSLLNSYVSALQVEGSRGFTPITVKDNDLDASFYKSLSMNIYDETMYDMLSDMSISFFYVDQSVNSNVQPSRGDIIKPSVEIKKADNHVPQRQSNTYKFAYDMSYPVIIEIRGKEPDSEISEYSFLFALESNIIENKPVLAWLMGFGTVEWDTSNIDVDIKIPENPVDLKGNTISMPKSALSTSKSLFCNEDTWVSGDVSVRVTDEFGKPLDDVTVTYGCGIYDECWLGNTEIDEFTKVGIWKGKLPLCQGGYLMLSKEGYGTKTIKLSTQENIPLLIPTQKLFKIRELEATIKKAEIIKNIYRDGEWEWKEDGGSIASFEDLTTYEQVIISISQTGFDAGSEPISNVMIFGKDNIDKNTIDLVPGTYEISATFIDSVGFTIPKNCSRVCSKVNIFSACTKYNYYPEDIVKFSPAPWGGVSIKSDTTGVFTVTAADLDSNKGLEFHVLKLPDLSKSSPPGGCVEHLDEMTKIDEYSKKFKSQLMPVFK